MATAGWAGVRKLSPVRKRTRLIVVNELARYFVENVTLAEFCTHNEWFTQKIIRELLKEHPEEHIRGMLEDVVFLSEELIAGRIRGLKIKSAGWLKWAWDKYDPDTKVIEDIYSRDYDEFSGESSDLIVVGGDT